MTAPTATVRAAVKTRDGGRCVACHAGDELTFQHRRAVGMGGSKTAPPAVDGLVLCLKCNEACEGSMQTLALAHGWKARKWTDPTKVPVYYPHEFSWFLLEGIGRLQITAVVALDAMHSVYGDQYMHWYAEAKN